MKKIAFLAALAFLALLIVLTITSSVNQTVGNLVFNNGTLRADGMPGPILPPKKPRAATAVPSDTHLLIADGMPGPILPPKKPLAATAMRGLESV
jgi:hypothetical protein